jgi:hypothetical protein
MDLRSPSTAALHVPLLQHQNSDATESTEPDPRHNAAELVGQVQRCSKEQLPAALHSLGMAVRGHADLVEEMLHAGIAILLKDILESNDAEIVASCCFAVHSLAAASDRARRVLGTRQMTMGIVQALRSFQDLETIKHATWAIRNLSLVPENRALLVHLQAHVVVLHSMRQLVAASWSNTAEPVGALMALAADQTVLKDLRDAGAASAAKSALDLYTSPTMLADCIGMIYNLAFDRVLAEQLQALFVCESILALMARHPKHRGLQLAGVCAIGNIAANTMPDPDHYRNIGAHAHIAAALEAFPKDGELKHFAQLTAQALSGHEEERRQSCRVS